MMTEWITTKEAAELSGYHSEYVRQLIREGKIGAQKFGEVWQVNRKSLLDYVSAAKESTDGRYGSKRT